MENIPQDIQDAADIEYPEYYQMPGVGKVRQNNKAQNTAYIAGRIVERAYQQQQDRKYTKKDLENAWDAAMAYYAVPNNPELDEWIEQYEANQEGNQTSTTDQ